MTLLHWCILTGTTPGEPEQYTATCGYTSTTRKEFRFDSMERVTCPDCLEKYNHGTKPEKETMR